MKKQMTSEEIEQEMVYLRNQCELDEKSPKYEKFRYKKWK